MQKKTLLFFLVLAHHYQMQLKGSKLILEFKLSMSAASKACQQLVKHVSSY
jgi:hypothetical protein